MRLPAATHSLKNPTSSIRYHVDHVILQLVGLFMFKEAMPRKNFVFRKYLQTSLVLGEKSNYSCGKYIWKKNIVFGVKESLNMYLL